MKKQKIEKALTVINKYSGKRETPEIKNAKRAAWGVIEDEIKMKYMTVDIAAAEFDIDPRYKVQVVSIPKKKRGNLSEFAGKDCLVFTTTISRGGPRINFYICQA